MSNTIRGFQLDHATILVDRINEKFPADTVSIERVDSLMVKHGIVNDTTHWRKVELVLADLGYDYDEIFEVAR